MNILDFWGSPISAQLIFPGLWKTGILLMTSLALEIITFMVQMTVSGLSR